MRSDRRQAQALFIRPRPFEVRGEVFLTARGIFKDQCFLVSANRAMARFRRREPAA